MRKKIIIAVCMGMVLLMAAALLYIRLMGGGGAGIDNEPEADVRGDSNVLVAYFSWSGNVQQMAGWVSEETGGDIFRIVPAEKYGEDFDTCADRAKNELDNGIRPELALIREVIRFSLLPP